MTSSCSFRITRSADDLSKTISLISERLIKLEQRQEAIDLRLKKSSHALSNEEISVLDGIDQTLRDCKDLLEKSSQP